MRRAADLGDASAERLGTRPRLGRTRFQPFPDLHQPEQLVLAIAAPPREVLDLVLERAQLLGVRDAAVVEAFLLRGGLLRERVDLVLELALVASDHVQLQAELAQISLGGVGFLAGRRQLASRLERPLARR